MNIDLFELELRTIILEISCANDFLTEKNNIFEKLLKLNEFSFLFVLICKFSPDGFKYQKLA